MKHEILRTVNYLEEALMLFKHLEEGEKFVKLRELLTRRYDLDQEENRNKFELLIRLEKDAEKVFRKQKEKISYYFGKKSENLEFLAKFALLWRECGTRIFRTTEELKDYLEQMPEEEYWKRFGGLLQNYGTIVYDDEDLMIFTSPLNVMRRILKMDIPDDEKLRIQDVFLDKEAHRKQVFALLEQAVSFLKRYDAELNEQTERFYKYWSKCLKKESIADYIRNEVNISLDENPNGSILCPQIISLNQIGISVDTESGKKEKNIFRMGILFGESVSPRAEDKRKKDLSDYAIPFFKILSDKSKLEILLYLKDKKAYGSELAKHMGLTTATISYHMSALINAGLVKMEKENTKLYYQADTKAIMDTLALCQEAFCAEEGGKENREPHA